MATTDRGSNEVTARRLIAAEVSEYENVYYFEQDCLEHSPHLVVMSGLLLVDKLLASTATWKYWSSLAMCSYTCRDQARALYDCYCDRFGAMKGKEAVKSIFPRPVCQRWGRIDELEKRIIKAGFSQLATCLADI